MQELETICPYPGLRPFTEEESLYFKGREDHIIKIIHLLEEKKFLMVTGASGDGKSSLIYGGLIPQARAGFFKASYSNWYVAGFRPERSPMKSMIESVASQLRMDKTTIEVELSRGFSSLVELYKSSPLYIDKQSKEWHETSEENRNQLERRAGNLLVIIDQFEEFFTNPENFSQGVPSQDARLLLNIILETSKISLRDDLPIYVVCTMRSDYIGQCASFSGLPEFIGFSQFFVPRLQRKELQQVIEEPAILSGNSISHRLTDRLIFDLEEGFDQLPILQHALKQIWKAADSGRETMDLIHYAMVGGMDSEKLPKEDLSRFLGWKEKLPEYEKNYLDKPGLAKILDIHANKLYEEAATYYNREGLAPLTGKEAKLIIGLSFSCLTRIDANRPVRNRMTLNEITRIINVAKFSTEVVAGVISIFREPESTLVRPFIEESRILPEPIEPETVLDITHEALIRNWQLLKKWSGREFEYYSVFLDLKQQLNRWTENGKSSDYLLPIGPLTYFENWYKHCRPNKFWINRYNESESSPEGKLKESEIILHNIQKFLRRSALQLFISRTFMKYGAAKIARLTGLIALLGISILLVRNWQIRRDRVVIHKLIREGTSLLKDKEASAEWKAFFVLFSSRLDTSNISAISREITDNQTRIDISLKIFERLFFINKDSDPPIRGQALTFADSLIRQSNPLSALGDISALNKNLYNFNDLVRDESYYLQSKSDPKMSKHLAGNISLLGRMITGIFAEPTIDSNIDIKALNIGIENTLNFRSLNSDQIKELINLISPFGNSPSASQKFAHIFPEKARLNVGVLQSVSHNGGYEKLGYLYAALGDVPHVLSCLDSLTKYNDNYDQYWNNSKNIGGYFLMYGHRQEFQKFVKAYSNTLRIPGNVYLKTIVTMAGITESRRQVKFIQHGNFNENLALFDYYLVKELFEIYKSSIEEEIKDRNELNFNLALLYKHEGAVYGKNYPEKVHRNSIDSLFSLAINYYSKLPKEFLNTNVEVYIQQNLNEIEKRVMKRSHLFLYPDHFKIGESFTYAGFFRYYGDDFFNFMIRHNLFTKYYHNPDDYKLLITWANSYFDMYGILLGTGYWNRAALNYTALSQATLISIDSIIVGSGYSELLDDDWLNLKLANDYFETGDTLRAFEKVNKIKFLEFNKAYDIEDIPFHNILLTVTKQLSIRGKRNKAMEFLGEFSNNKNKTLGYSKLAAFTKMNGLDKESEFYRDSALADLKLVKFFRVNSGELGYDYRTGLVEMLTLQNDLRSNRQAQELVNNMDFDAKLNGVLARVRTLARMDKYYAAWSSIPEQANPEDRLRCILAILYVEVQKRSGSIDNNWSKFDKDLLGWIDYTEFLNDLDEF